MVSLIIWRAGIFLELLVAYRFLRTRTLLRYPFFFAYIAISLLADTSGYIHFYLAGPALYSQWYWVKQIVTLIAGYGILLEIQKHVLSPYPGAERFARNAGIVAFGLVFCFAVVYTSMMPAWSVAGTTVEFERALRTVQAVFLFGILGVIAHYRIEIGKNMRGMIFGYGLYIGTSLMSLAVRSYAGTSFDTAWNFIQPFSWVLSLFIWLAALWSYYPSPAPASATHLETDYEAFVVRTKVMMGTMRSHLAKAARP
jgi:hypothetical protein